MNIEIVNSLIKAPKVNYKIIRSILEKDDETILYFLDEYPIKKIAFNSDIKKIILAKIKRLYSKYKHTHIGNIETLLNATIALFPKNFFHIVGTKSIKSYSFLFQITIFDYCLQYVNCFYKKDIFLFIKHNSSINNHLIGITKLMIQFTILKEEKLLQQIIESAKANKEDTLFVERMRNTQKDLNVFTKKQFTQLEQIFLK